MMITDDYFNCLIELHQTYSIVCELINDYGRINDSIINPMEIIILHTLTKNGGSAFPRDLYKLIPGLAGNHSHNIKNLVKKGYLSAKKGKDLGIDNRLTQIVLTKKGNDFYEGLCNIITEKLENSNIDFFLKEINLLRKIFYDKDKMKDS